MRSDNLRPNVYTYASAMAACKDQPEEVLSLFQQMTQKDTIAPNTVVMTTAINALARAGGNYTGKGVETTSCLSVLIQTGLDIHRINVLIAVAGVATYGLPLLFHLRLFHLVCMIVPSLALDVFPLLQNDSCLHSLALLFYTNLFFCIDGCLSMAAVYVCAVPMLGMGVSGHVFGLVSDCSRTVLGLLSDCSRTVLGLVRPRLRDDARDGGARTRAQHLHLQHCHQSLCLHWARTGWTNQHHYTYPHISFHLHVLG